MPSSFSRFLSDDELQQVRELYLQSLEEADLDGPVEGDGPVEASADDERRQSRET